jgi:hypothetical protein
LVRQEKLSKKLARLTTNGRTLHPHSAIRAIKAAFIPKLLYGIELFWKDNKKIEHKLQVIINHSIRFALSPFRTTPIPALQVESNIPPNCDCDTAPHSLARSAILYATIFSTNLLKIELSDIRRYDFGMWVSRGPFFFIFTVDVSFHREQ